MKVLTQQFERIKQNSGETVFINIPKGTVKIGWFAVCTGAAPTSHEGYLRMLAKTTNQTYDYLIGTALFTIVAADAPNFGSYDKPTASHFAWSVAAGAVQVKFFLTLNFYVEE